MKSNKNELEIITSNNITALQKIALEGEIAKALSTARHDAEILYRYYILIKNTPKELSYLLVQIFRDMTDIKQELLDRVMLETSLDITPVWIWLDKVVADLKLSIKLACSDSMGEASMDRKELQKKLVKSAFVYFCRKVAMVSPTAAQQLCRHVIDEEPIDLAFLEDACFALIPEIQELEQDEKVSDTVLTLMFDIGEVLSYRVETEVLEKRADDKEGTKEEKVEDIEEGKPIKLMDKDGVSVYAAKVNFEDNGQASLSEIFKETINKIIKEREAKEQTETGKFMVVKEYDGCDVVTPLRECDSEEEAHKFIDSMKKQFPELTKTVKFRVRKI